MDTIDSKQQQLPFHEVLLRYVTQDPYLGDKTPEQAIALLLKELSLPQVSYKQMGNTIIAAHRKDEIPDKAYIRLISVDTPQNIMEQVPAFTNTLQEEGVRILYAVLQDDTYVRMYRMAIKQAREQGEDVQLIVRKNKAGQYVMAVIYGES